MPAGIQLKTVGQHPRGNVVDTRRQAYLEIGDSRWSARAVYLSIVSIQIRAETVPFNKTDYVSSIKNMVWVWSGYGQRWKIGLLQLL